MNTPEDRLVIWRNLRLEIEPMSTEKKIEAVVDFFSQTPISSRVIDYYSPDSWPSPWELLFDGTYCTSAISLLMYYTFTMSSTFKDEVKLILADTSDDRILLPLINDKYVINYQLGASLDINDIDNLTVIDVYQRNHIIEYT